MVPELGRLELFLASSGLAETHYMGKMAKEGRWSVGSGTKAEQWQGKGGMG